MVFFCFYLNPILGYKVNEFLIAVVWCLSLLMCWGNMELCRPIPSLDEDDLEIFHIRKLSRFAMFTLEWGGVGWDMLN